MSDPRSTSLNGSAPRGALFVVVALGALAGAAGVALSAVAAHRVESPGLATAATMLMIHATAILALCGVAAIGRLSRAWLGLALAMLLGVGMFSGAVALSKLADISIPMLAPTGGMVLIASWLGAAILASLSARAG